MDEYSPSAIELIWPTKVFAPDAKLVYLDLNHFIYIARSQADGADRRLRAYEELFDTARTAKSKGDVIFPLSTPHVYEISAIKDPKQRAALTEVMEELSDFRYLLGRSQIARYEIAEALDRRLATRTEGSPIQLVGTSLGWAFGRRGGVVIMDGDGRDVSDRLRRELGSEAFEAKMAAMNGEMERSLLRGPSDEELVALRAAGYAPEKAEISHHSRTAFELDLVRILNADDIWRRGRLRDVVGARELTHEWIDFITEEMLERGTTVGNVLSDRNAIRTFSDQMPSTRVAVSIKTRYHRNPQHGWTPNDINDIDAMAIAVPYCDVVFTDKAVRNAVVSSPELRCFETFLPRRPEDLTEWLLAVSPAR